MDDREEIGSGPEEAMNAQGRVLWVPVRRSPKVVPFLLVGIVLGGLLGAVFTWMTPANPEYEPISTLGFFVFLGALAGVTVAGLAFIALDALSRRRARPNLES